MPLLEAVDMVISLSMFKAARKATKAMEVLKDPKAPRGLQDLRVSRDLKATMDQQVLTVLQVSKDQKAYKE